MPTKPTMPAVHADRYGPPEVLHIRQMPVPEPKPNEVRVRILASAVTASDIFIRSAQVTPRLQIPFRLMMGITRPRQQILGFVFSGIVDATGADTSRFTPGDQVYGCTGFRLGAYAEYRCMPETDSRVHGCLAHKPANLSHEEATAAAYGGLLALQYVEKGHIHSGDSVLIYGASGTSGTIAVQYAKALGAHVTAVCGTANLDLVRALGADHVLDYTTSDAPPPGSQYTFVLDSVGGLKSSKLKEACKLALEANGRWVSIDDGDLQLSSQRLGQITTLVESGTLKPVVGAAYPLERIVEAHRYVQTGHKRGGVAITI
jgi:NADPH:quinone reductase-like Zn-dependent oxidoreductase